MDEMFSEIENLIIKVLRDNLDLVPRNNIGFKWVNFKRDLRLPAVSIENVDFKVEEPGIGRALNSVEKEIVEIFSGDGQETRFSLSKKPLKPTVKVEHPPGRKLREIVDYSIDYAEGVVIFNSPPILGDGNIVVRYHTPVEIRGLKFKIKYHISVWADDESLRDAIAVKVIELLLREERRFTVQEIFLKPIGGFNVNSNELLPKSVYGKVLEYQVEAQLQVEVPVPRIERIEIRRM